MTVVPAKVAGVLEVILATPCRPDGEVDPYVLVAAAEAGATDLAGGRRPGHCGAGLRDHLDP